MSRSAVNSGSGGVTDYVTDDWWRSEFFRYLPPFHQKRI